MSLEHQIINQLFHNERYCRSILPYLSAEYFVDDGNRTVFEQIEAFVNKYSSVPTTSAIAIEVEQAILPEHIFTAAQQTLEDNRNSDPVDYEWLCDQTEKYAKDRAVHNALRESISILDDEKRSNGEIEVLLQKALSVSFDTNLGLDVLEDAEKHYDLTHSDRVKIPFMIETFNRATEGGAEPATLNVIMAGCVSPQTMVLLRYMFEGVQRTVRCPIKRAKDLLEDGLFVEISSPNGFVRVTQYVEKGLYPRYDLVLEDGTRVESNEDHLYKTNLYGWMSAKEISELTTDGMMINLCTSNGLRSATVIASDFVCDIVDIVVDDPSHAYYANTVESHNTNVGKSLILCHLAGDYLLQGKNVLYVTFEMSEEKIAQRVYANILDVALDDHKVMPKPWFLAAIEKIKKKTTGRLKVKEYPNGGAHVGHIRHHIRELKLKQGFVPDVVIFDYLTIMASSRYKPSQCARHTYLQAIAQEIRGLMQELKTLGFSALQVNRGGFESSDPGMTDLAGSFDLTGDVDWFISVSQSEEMMELGQFLVSQDKSRYSNKDYMRKFVIGVDKDKQRIFDVDTQQQSTKPAANDQGEGDKFAKFFN